MRVSRINLKLSLPYARNRIMEEASLSSEQFKPFYAHSAQDKLGNLLPYEHWQTLQSHSLNVGEIAGLSWEDTNFIREENLIF